jgi:D-arabinose 1-dehydrogenase-like Zn-dependent alcohol dehydrogenase
LEKIAERRKTLKTLLLKAPKEVVFEEVPIPSISDDEVLIEVKYCGICGSPPVHIWVTNFLGFYLTSEKISKAGK